MVSGLDGLLEDDRLLPVDSKDPEALERALTKRWDRNFTQTIQALSVDHCDLLENGIKLACSRQKDIVAMGTRLIEKRMIQSNGHFRQATIETKNTFTNPVALGKLGLFVVDAHKEHMESMGRKHKYRELPLILASLCDVRNSYMVVGIPQNKRVSTRKRKSIRSRISGRSSETAKAHRG
eukprot:TRINITY_DN5688_c0_g2_i1.p1 TRINITY_DN5688_c0_g2~~TRINITY_DN5688_c0_g2_i1.p1  ORF type:complete len:193 (-),score=27.66 TRINITY_DN5688_c0_g2_i1:2-541(-)